MLLNIKCSVVSSIEVNLTFDDNSTKTAVVALGDLIEVEYNSNGLRRQFEGKVISIKANGSDPKAWYITVDGSGDFDSDKARFSPMSILDINIIQKADSLECIGSPRDITNIKAMRLVKGRLQCTQDGVNWFYPKIDKRDIVIKDEEGTCSENYDRVYDEDLIIKDEVQ